MLRMRSVLTLAALLAPSLPAQRIVDLGAGQHDVLVRGPGPFFAQAGWSVAAGDVNGDAIADVVVGAPGRSGPGGAGTGAAYVVYGRTSFPPNAVIDLAVTPADLTVYGQAPADLLGLSVAAGDVNGDGRADLVLGAPSNQGTRAGKIHVVLGSSSFPPQHVIDLSTTPAAVTMLGSSTTAHLGIRVAAADVNGDLKADVIATTEPGLFLPRVQVHVLYGAVALPPLVDLEAGPSDLTIRVATDTVLGVNVALLAARIDPDAIADLALGLPEASFVPDRFLAGRVLAVRGSAAFPPQHLIDLDATVPFLEVRGDDAYDRLGFSLAAGDVNGGGIADLAIAAPQGLIPGVGPGKVHVVYGLAAPPASRLVDLNAGPADLTFMGIQPGDGTGGALAIADLNGDAISDLAIGVPYVDPPGRPDAGAALITLGRTTFPPQATIFLSSSPGNLAVLGARARDLWGWSMATGDVNGDLRPDLLVGAPAFDAAAADAGGVAVVYGGPLTDAGSFRIGSTAFLDVEFLGDGGLPYLGAAALSGERGVGLGDGRRIPLDPDPLFVATVLNQLPALFPRFAGLLDPEGRARPAIAIPDVPALVGLQFYVAFCSLELAAGGVRSISNRLPILIEP